MALSWSRLWLFAASLFSLHEDMLVCSYESQDVRFDCPQLPHLTQPAKTVHELRPQDIKVVMALGDSVTAGIKA